MSHYATVETEFRDPGLLIACLREQFKEVESYEMAQHLYGYHGDERPELAHIIVRRKYVGDASNDIGFVRTPEGAYRAIVSDYDRRTQYGEEWMGRLRQGYAVQTVKRQALRSGYRVVGQTVDEKGRVRLTVET